MRPSLWEKFSMNIWIKILCISLSVLAFGCDRDGPSSGETSSVVSKIDSLMKSHHQQGLFDGGIVITSDGDLLYENYFGIADRQWNIPFNKNTKLDVASVNKSMIAALIMKATEEGLLELSDKLVDILPKNSYSGYFDPNISLHHLLSHTSGLPDYGNIDEELKEDNFLKFKRSRFSNNEYIDFISNVQSIGKPGQQFHYSNFAYHLAAIIIEITYDVPFAQVLEKKLTIPLGLKNTLSSSKNEFVVSNLAKAYNYDKTTSEWLENPFIDLSIGRRIFSTPSDLSRWAQVIDNPGWLTKPSLELVQKNHLHGISQDYTYGYGWVIFDKENTSRIGDLDISKPYIIHGGSTDGYKSMLININNNEYIVSFLSNVGDRTDEIEIAKKIINNLIN